jgi:hypothetical protein
LFCENCNNEDTHNHRPERVDLKCNSE